VKGEKLTCSLQGYRAKTGRFFEFVKEELIRVWVYNIYKFNTHY
jgi:hypothetical protein